MNMNVSVSVNVVSRIGALAGRRCTEAMAALLLAVDRADVASGRIVLSGDLFSCLVSVPTETSGHMQLRACWVVDERTHRKVVMRVGKG